MAAGRIHQLDAEQWVAAQEQVREGGGTAVGVTLVDGRLLLVLQAIAERDGQTVMAPGAELRSVQPETLRAALRRRDGETPPVERPAGSVATKPQWALMGAIEAVREVPPFFPLNPDKSRIRCGSR